MHIPLSEFEHRIPPTILERGLEYYEQGRVIDLRPIDKGGILAIVHGQEDHEVELKLKNQVLVSATCSCPYEHGDICKHIVAVIFAIQETEFKEGIEGSKSKKKAEAQTFKSQLKKGVAAEAPKKAKPAKEKAKKLTIRDLVGAVPHNELVEWVAYLCAHDRALANQFKVRFADYEPVKNKAEIRKRIKSLGVAPQGASGKKKEQILQDIQKAVTLWWERFEDARLAEDFETALVIMTALHRESRKIYASPDVYPSVVPPQTIKTTEALIQWAADALPDKVRQELFTYIQDYIDQSYGLAVEPQAIHLLTLTARTEADKALISPTLERILATRWYDDPLCEAILQALQDTLSPKEAQQALKRHSAVPVFRRLLIQKSLEEKDYTTAIQLAEDGFQNERYNAPKPSPWWKVLLDIYVAKGDLQAQIDTLVRAFIHSDKGYDTFYRQLRDLTPPDHWPATKERILSRLTEHSMEQMAYLYMMEDDLDTLLKKISKMNVETAVRFQLIFEQQKATAYCDALYLAILHELDKSRSAHKYGMYQYALGVIKKLCGREYAKELTAKIIARYPNSQGLHRALSPL